LTFVIAQQYIFIKVGNMNLEFKGERTSAIKKRKLCLKEAIFHNQKVLSHKGNVFAALNSSRECRYLLGKKEEAIRTWKKSIEINPNQDNRHAEHP